MNKYHFTVDHIAETEQVEFTVEAESVKSALQFAQLINPNATLTKEELDVRPATIPDETDGSPF